MERKDLRVNTKAAQMHLERCREGESIGNGYNLWVRSHILRENGMLPKSLGTTDEEVRGHLIQDLRSWITQIQNGDRDTETANLDLAIMYAYFLPNISESDPDLKPVFPLSLPELGLTETSLAKLEKGIDLKDSQEELIRCRQEKPSLRFWGLKNKIVTGELTLEEIGATAEEIERYAQNYQKAHPAHQF
jgi:hypothetical protein